jgi:hypothetical protein
MAVADSMLLFEREKRRKSFITYAKSVKILCIMACWERPLNFPSTKKFQKIQLQIGIVVACPKSLNSIYGIHGPLGIKIQLEGGQF